jgi:hypothetical protein
MKAFTIIISLGILCCGEWPGVASADSLAVPVPSFGAEGRNSTLTIVFGSPVGQMGGGRAFCRIRGDDL